MKRLLLAAVVCSTITYPPVQAYQDQDDFVKTVVLSVIGTCAGIASLDYIASKFPSHRLASAQKAYMNLDDYLATLSINFDIDRSDIAQIATQWYPHSAYPLVTLFHSLSAFHEEADAAVKKLENAIWWSKDEFFVRTCNRQKDLIKKHVAMLEKITSIARSNAAWAPQYSLYMQQCNNDQLRDISFQLALNGFSHCCNH